MKKTVTKLVALIAIIALVLTGCSLIGVDEVKQAQENFDKLKKDYSTVLAKYDGGEITLADVAYDYNSQYSYMSYMYQVYGYTFDSSQAQSLMQDVVESHMTTRAVLAKANELGIELTEEEKAECAEEAQKQYDEAYATAYESAEGDTEELKKLNTEYRMYSMGQTMEFFTNQQEWSKIIDKVEEVTKPEVEEVDDIELETILTEQEIEDEKTYSEDLAKFEKDMTDPDIFIAWRPEGYRTVKHILLMPGEETKTKIMTLASSIATLEGDLSDLEDELEHIEDADGDEEDHEHRTADEINADIDTVTAELETERADLETAKADAVAEVRDRYDEVMAKLEAGEDFDALMAEYGEDPGMQSEPAMSRGYYVSAESTSWDTDFRDAAMALENVGDYTTEPIVSTSGVHIIYYNSDVIAGQVQLEDVRDEFYDIALEKARDEYMEGKVDEWTAALKPVYSVDKYFNR